MFHEHISWSKVLAFFIAIFAVVLILFTQKPKPLSPISEPIPEWLIHDELSCKISCYKDLLGHKWWRLNFSEGAKEFRMPLSLLGFQKGCRVRWFASRALPLLLLPQPGHLPLPAPKIIRPNVVFSHSVSSQSINNGASLFIPGPVPAISIFLNITQENIQSTKLDYHDGSAFWVGGRFIFLTVSFIIICAFFLFVVDYHINRHFASGILALSLSFAFAALWFDSPSYSKLCLIDKGDDSYYLAYAQNIINYGTPFKFPTNIAFGRRHVDKAHGLPGTGIMLSPPLLVSRSLHKSRRGSPILAGELREMRALSASYSFLAMLFLFEIMRCMKRRHEYSSLDIFMPVMLLYGTSLMRWTFARSIFSHSSEILLLCATLFFAEYQGLRNRCWRNCVIAILTGLLFLVRGEYLPIAILFLFLPSSSVDETTYNKIANRILPLLILVGFAAIYFYWVNQIPSGYGSQKDICQHFIFENDAIFPQLARNFRILLLSYAENGGMLIVACFSAIIICLFHRFRDLKIDFPFNPWIFSLITIMMFIMNNLYSPPLGDEFGHRYSLKLYPFAFVWLGIIYSQVFKQTTLNKSFKMLVATYMLGVFIANMKLLMESGCGSNGQNFSFLSDAQLLVMPIGGVETINLRIALLFVVLSSVFKLLEHKGKRTHNLSKSQTAA